MMEAALLLFFLLLGSSFAKPSLFNPEVIVASPYGNVVSRKSPIISNLPDRQYHTATGLSSFPSGSSNTIGSILGEKQLVSANKYYLQNQEFVQPKESKNSELSPSFSDIRKPSYNQCTEKFSKQQINNVEQWKPPSAVYKEQYGSIIETGGTNQQSSYNQDRNSANSIAPTMFQTSSETKSLQSSSQTNYNQKASSLDTTSSIVSTGKSEDPIPLAPTLITTVNKPSCSMDQTRNNQQCISSNPIPSFELSGVSQSSPSLIPIERNNQQLSSSDAFESFVDKGTVKPHRPLALTNTAANIKSSTVTSQDKSSSASFNHHDEINSTTVVKYLGSLEKTSSDSGKDTSFQSSPSSCTKQNKLPTDHKDSNHQKEEKHGKHAKHHKSHHKESSKSHKINHNQESVPKHKTHDAHHHKHKYSKNSSQESIAHKKYEDTNKSHTSKHHSGKTQEKLGNLKQSILHKKASEKFEPITDVVTHWKANNEQKHKKHSKKHHKNKEQKENKPENNKKHKNRSTNGSSSESKHHHKINKSADTSHVAKTSKENSCS